MTDYWSKLKLNECWSDKQRYNIILNYIESKLGNAPVENPIEQTVQEEEDDGAVKTGNIIVTVTNKDTGDGVSGVLVTVHDDDETINLTGTTGSAGGCTIKDVPYGEYTISAEHDSYIGDVDIVTVDSEDVIFDFSIEAIDDF